MILILNKNIVHLSISHRLHNRIILNLFDFPLRTALNEKLRFY